MIHAGYAGSQAWWHRGGMTKPLDRKELTLRLPLRLHRLLTSVAVDNGRSLNAEIVQRLRRSLEGTSSTNEES